MNKDDTMKTNDHELLENVKRYIIDFFGRDNVPALSFYTIEHTTNLVESVKAIADHASLHKKDLHLVEIAAWFHDTGYLTDKEKQLEASERHAREFLEKEKVDDHSIKIITSAIASTALPLQPSGLLEQILCDAVFSFLSKKSFAISLALLRKDMSFFRGKEISDAEWQAEYRVLIAGHHYFTPYGRSKFEDKEMKHLEDINQDPPAVPKEDHHPKHHQDPDESPGESKKPKRKYDKSVDMMFKIVSTNNQRLSAMADRKAHILITVNSIILSVIISVMFRKLDENILLVYPTFLLMLVGLTTIIISILATRPVIPGGAINHHSLASKIVNPLYFGNSYPLKLSEYIDEMLSVMDDSDQVYRALLASVYQQGEILTRKYTTLRKAYNIFMVGLIISILGFIVAYSMHHSSADALSIKYIKIKK